MKRMRAFPITTLAALLAVLVFVISRLSGQDIFESIVRVLDQVEHYEIDEIIALCLLILGGLLLDLIINRSRQARAAEISAQRLGVFKATMRTVQDIVNNFLNNLQLFRLEAQDALPSESLETFDTLVQETSAKLKALGELESTPEKEVAEGPVIDFDTKPKSPPA